MLDTSFLCFILSATTYYFGASRRSRNGPALRNLFKLGIFVMAFVCSLLPLLSPNYYTLFNVAPAASQSEIATATRHFLRRLSGGDDEFQTFAQHCAKTLNDGQMRKVYNAYGDLFHNGSCQNADELLIQSLTMSALWAVAMFVGGWLLLSPSIFRFGRKALALWCVVAFCLEARTRVFQDSITLGSFRLLPFEVALLLRSFVSTIFVLSMIVSDLIYTNTEETLRVQINNLMKVQAITIAHLQCLAKHSGVDVASAMPGWEPEETDGKLRKR
eukprot:Gregarina_sp_Pseudo_9__5528@NODE_724_length_2312_cov_14_842499_g680_i0_p2_GENE_NODE_724_length_2312_cov_14_842499_g680_i0NODE_724_length_2312_cov_14_842499_g680_i0_p2_ORF_typecomplete_len273_score8_95DUF2277/PF10041_9/0_0057DUF2277/PF10041_9/4_4e03Wzy_C/PF04932_15/0_05Wzy_C/PF04932_15/2_2e02MatE/PF01554_18/0_086MatE/PF01554_18/18MatE/PF01554_18/4_8e03DnaJ/PF00226_31/0_32_NODE_724_length_2312_cov_14_842499_g680_i032850